MNGQANLTVRQIKNYTFFVFLILMSMIALLPLFTVLWYVIINGLPNLNLDFLTKLPAPVGIAGGMANAIVGSLILVGVATIVAVPIGVGSGIYVAEYAGTRFASVIRFISDVLSGVPSIVAGLLIYGLVVVAMGNFSALAGGLSLAVLMLPTLTRTTEQMLVLVPVSLREGALALGATRMQTIMHVVLPAATRGLTTGIMLAIARVMGETAPLLFTAFGNSYWQNGLTTPIAALPLQIFVYATSPYPSWQAQAWTGALTLLGIILLINVTARLIARASTR